MKIKRLLIISSITAALIIPATVFASSSNAPVAKPIRGFFGIDTSKLTEQQKTAISDYSKKISDLQKEFINKMVENGTLTKEQGEAQIKRIDDMLAAGGIEGVLPGAGRRGYVVPPGIRKGLKANRIDTSRLTDDQKAQLNNTYKKMADLQKEYIGKMVANGLITKAQGDLASSRIDAILASIQNANLSKGFNLIGGFNCFGTTFVDESKLTEQQKSDLTDYRNRMAELQKELINQEVSFGLITKEQGDLAISRIDEMKNNPQAGIKGRMMKERFNRRGKPGNQRNDNNTQNSSNLTNTPAI